MTTNTTTTTEERQALIDLIRSRRRELDDSWKIADEIIESGWRPAGAIPDTPAEITELRRELAEARAARVSDTALYEDGVTDLVEEVHRLRGELAEAGAARPAPMPPEVVAVVEAARFLEREVNANGDRGGRGWDRVLTTVRALPEGWRDGAAPADAGELRWVCDGDPSGVEHANFVGWSPCPQCRVVGERQAAAAPAAVPAELDPAGVDRVARLLAEQRGVPGKQYDTLPSFTKTAGIERARAVVRAYLGDTDDSREG